MSNTPARKSATTGNNARGNATGVAPKNLTNRTKATANAGAKSTYKRSAVPGYNPQMTPSTRSSEGSVLTPGSIKSGANQPFLRTTPQRMSKIKKGAD